MTARKQALSDLLAKVEAGSAGQTDCWKVSDKNGAGWACFEAYNGSFDAALALHNAVLPDEGWEVFRTAKYPGMIPGSSRHEFAAKVGWGKTVRGEASTPACALLIADLKALIAGEDA
jgi:hypothetical protein